MAGPWPWLGIERQRTAAVAKANVAKPRIVALPLDVGSGWAPELAQSRRAGQATESGAAAWKIRVQAIGQFPWAFSVSSS